MASLSPEPSLDHLLAVCLEGHLIEGFENGDEHVVIALGDARHVLQPADARLFLHGILKYAPWLQQISTVFDEFGKERSSLRPLA